MAGLNEIPAVVRDLSDEEALAVALIENIQREDLTPAEEARALSRLAGEYALTHERLAEIIGRSRAAVSNLIRLLDLPAAVLALVDAKKLSMGHARALLGLAKEAEREQFAQLIVERDLSVRQTEEMVRKAPEDGVHQRTSARSAVSEVLKTQFVHVRLQQKDNGTSRLLIDVSDAAQRDAIAQAIKKAAE